MTDPFMSGVLPRWQDGVIRLFDITPDEKWNGVLTTGLKIMTATLDVHIRNGLIVTNDDEAHFFDGHLEETQDENGRPGFVVDDRTFRGVFPYAAEGPVCIASYHMSFLLPLLGGPWDTPPWRMCLYRLARVFALDPEGDSGLETFARKVCGSAWEHSGADNWYDPPAVKRVLQARLVLAALLGLSRPNMLVALSCAHTLPPPVTEPFGRAPGWKTIAGEIFREFE